uniref:Uncharacterized protein n=1 Tax=Clytia hemisphaerica TaxID=252671 RepID=A0A7M5X380_9CNID|eukprot:TCONS_00000211-protein
MKYYQVLTICAVLVCLLSISESRSIAKRTNNYITYETCIKHADDNNETCYADIPWFSNEFTNDDKLAMNDACVKKHQDEHHLCLMERQEAQKHEHASSS